MRKYPLLNAFSLNMLPSDVDVTIRVSSLSLEDVLSMIESNQLDSAIGHKETAALLSTMLGVNVPVARTTVVLAPNDWAVIAQYIGPRLAEGATTLPRGARIDFKLVEIT